MDARAARAPSISGVIEPPRSIEINAPFAFSGTPFEENPIAFSARNKPSGRVEEGCSTSIGREDGMLESASFKEETFAVGQVLPLACTLRFDMMNMQSRMFFGIRSYVCLKLGSCRIWCRKLERIEFMSF